MTKTWKDDDGIMECRECPLGYVCEKCRWFISFYDPVQGERQECAIVMLGEKLGEKAGL